MARLSNNDLVEILAAKGFEAVDLSGYKNLESPVVIKCEKGHVINTNMKKARQVSFNCPKCMGGKVSINTNTAPPEKKGIRIIALDNASENMGLSIFDDGELVFYTIITYSGHFNERITSIFETIHNTIIREWEPDYLVFEDVQFQRNYNTYKKLSMLLGVLVVSARFRSIKNETVPVKKWRSYYQISNTRKQAKIDAVRLVKKMYDIDVVHDIAEAILIGRYAWSRIEAENIQDAF